MPASTFFAIIFFLMLITLGLDSTVSEWGRKPGFLVEIGEEEAGEWEEGGPIPPIPATPDIGYFLLGLPQPFAQPSLWCS